MTENADGRLSHVTTSFQPEASGALWCVHALGPDELHAAPNMQAAALAAAGINQTFASRAIKPFAIATLWPGTAEEHAADLQGWAARFEKPRRAPNSAEDAVAAARAPHPDDLETMLADCVPGGSYCDPQQVADAIRNWVAARPAGGELRNDAGREGLADLHGATRDLIERFALALMGKAAAAQRKYGYGANWAAPNWESQLQWELVRHVGKGDPLDVALYCAFAWAHSWSTRLPILKADELQLRLGEMGVREVDTARAGFSLAVANIHRWSMRDLSPIQLSRLASSWSVSEPEARAMYEVLRDVMDSDRGLDGANGQLCTGGGVEEASDAATDLTQPFRTGSVAAQSNGAVEMAASFDSDGSVGVSIKTAHETAKELALIFLQELDEINAKNYLVLHFTAEDGRKVEVMIRRAEGLTPPEVYAAAQSEVDRANNALINANTEMATLQRQLASLQNAIGRAEAQRSKAVLRQQNLEAAIEALLVPDTAAAVLMLARNAENPVAFATGLAVLLEQRRQAEPASTGIPESAGGA